jgi:small subunit ribosomal protein S8
MNNSDLAKFLTALNAASKGFFKTTKVQNSKLVLLLVNIFDDYGIIRGYHIDNNDDNKIKIAFKFRDGFPIIFEIKQISKESKRVYVNLIELTKLKNKYSKVFYILSTPHGIMSDEECLRKQVGGEVLLKVVL